jgi:glycosyltransferase involved in cell wall biosynthesis
MDYLINEIAALGPDRPHLVMLGEEESETSAVRATADLLLGRQGFTIRTVGRDSIDRYYRAADVFALASIREAFGLVYAEALAHGLPCIAHDYPVSRFVLGEEGLFADLRLTGSLAQQVRVALAMDDTTAQRERRHEAVSQRFDWSALAPQYVDMFHQVALPPSAVPAARAVPEFRLDSSTGERCVAP